MSADLAAAVLASLVVVLSAPAIGQLRGAVEAAFPSSYRLLLVVTVGGLIGGFVLWALATIRHQRGIRIGRIVLALALGAFYSHLTATANATINAVERFHFVEYGLLALLFYRAWLARGGAVACVMAFMAALTVGTLDEGLQWFVPLRVGEWRDVLLDAVAIACGLLFSAGLIQPARGRSQPGSAVHGAVVMTAVACSALATFVFVVHVGYDVHDPDVGLFRSRYSAAELLALSADRARAWKTGPPATLRRYSREDQYMAEGLWHVQRRNQKGSGALERWGENLILEKYFAPILDHPTYDTPSGARWSEEQRRNARVAAGANPPPYASHAEPFPIYAWLTD